LLAIRPAYREQVVGVGVAPSVLRAYQADREVGAERELFEVFD
jgi:hypothetical protein